MEDSVTFYHCLTHHPPSLAGDSTLRIWSTENLTCLYLIHPYGEFDAGDIYSLAFLSSPLGISSPPCHDILWFGCQNTSLQWLDLSTLGAGQSVSSSLSSKLNSTFSSFTNSDRGSSDDENDEYEYDEHSQDYELPRSPTVPASTASNHANLRVPEQPIATSPFTRIPSSDSIRATKVPNSRPRLTKKPHKFFDSRPYGSQDRIQTNIPRNSSFSSVESGSASVNGSLAHTVGNGPHSVHFLASASVHEGSNTSTKKKRNSLTRVLRVPVENVIESAHYG